MDQQATPLSGGGSRNTTARVAIMAAVSVIFTGYLLLWVIMPTNTYKQNWLPLLRAKTTTAYFGTTQGATELVFTLPVLCIALLGCLYLHFGGTSANTNTKGGSAGREIWRRPMIFKGFGIVSRTEIAFFVMFVALLAWNLAAYLVNSFAKITTKSPEKLWEARLDMAALRLGLVGNIALSFLFFPVTRGSSVLPLLGLTSEASIKYHIWLGHIVMTFFTAHGICYVIFWAATNQISELWQWENTGISNLAGVLSLLAGLVLWATTWPRIRRKIFELFFYAHHLYILFVLFFVFHVGISYSSIMLPGFLLFMIDRYLRFLQSRKGVRLMSARVLPCEVVELNFLKSKSLKYTPMSIMFVNMASVSRLQWHPFTITSSSNLEPDTVSVVIKGEGSWTRRIHELLASPSSVDRLEVSVEGPYGPASTHFVGHDLLVMVSGGSGITPFISIIRELIYISEMQNCKIPKILLISAFKKATDLTMLDLILPASGAPSKLPATKLQIEAYVTREEQPPTHEKKSIRTICFKPNPSDAPVTPILGRNNNWLWLGVIISLSFIIYLVSIAMLTRYYIFPIDHNTNKIYSSVSRSMLHILFLCIGIIIAATTAFLWSKRNNARETAQIQNMVGATPTSTPNSLCHNDADTELESFPLQSLSQSINVHYGERPDLKRYLFDRKEPSVGVLASGPKQLRHNVAKICSSGLATNLHFESISFSW